MKDQLVRKVRILVSQSFHLLHVSIKTSFSSRVLLLFFLQLITKLGLTSISFKLFNEVIKL